MSEQRPYPSERVPIPGGGRPLELADLTLEDVEGIRLLLRGSSVVDWHHLDFRTLEDVDRFLRVNEFDPQSEPDMLRLEEIRADAVEYLSRNFAFRIPDQVAEGIPARDLFLVASRKGRRQVWACVILKVMHIIHHLAGRELLTRLPISSDQVFHMTELKIMGVVEQLRAVGYPIVEFQWSRKPRDSLITKLLAKRSTLAAGIYDRLRFRLIVRERQDLVPMLGALLRRAVPFNYVIPGESVNHLIPFRDLLHQTEALRRFEPELQHDHALERSQERAALAPLNEFSAPDYKIVNFVADIPVRVDEYLTEEVREFGSVVFVMTEFQLADRVTVDRNDQGESSHEAYKARQQQSVRRRLMRGRRSARTEGAEDGPETLEFSESPDASDPED